MLDAEATYWREKSEGGGWLLQLRGLIGAASRIAHEVCHSLAPSRPRALGVLSLQPQPKDLVNIDKDNM
jgi:hypothetical protein